MKSHSLGWRSCAVAAGALMILTGAAVPAAQFTVTQATGGMQGGQPPPPMARGTGVIIGWAIDGSGPRPVPGVVVTLTVPGAAPVRVMADAQGQFVFRDLPVGRFALTAARSGYLDGAYGRLRPGGQAQTIDLAAAQHVGDVTIALWRFAAITGRVIDEHGDPIVSASVRVLKQTSVAGRRLFVNGPMDSTDDRGVYRISSLEPGNYIVVVPMTQPFAAEAMIRSLGLPVPPPPPDGGAGNAAFVFRATMNGDNEVLVKGSDSGMPPTVVGEDGQVLTYQTEFYPAATAASRATSVTVLSGDERAGIDFQLKPVRAVNVSGHVTVPDGRPNNLSVTLLPADTDVFTPIETAMAMTRGDGGFQFTHVPPGQYTLHVQRTFRMPMGGETTTVVQNNGGSVMRMMTLNRGGGPGTATPPLPVEPTLWADVPVSVGPGDLEDVAVPMQNGLRVSGRVEFSGSATPPSADQFPTIGLTLDPADGRTEGLGSAVRGRVESTGQFTTMGVPPGKYLLRVTAPSGWVLRGAAANGQDASDVPIELRDGDASGVVITFTDRPSTLSGSATTPSGQPDAGAAVIVFPVDRQAWAGTGSTPRRLRNVRTAQDGSYSFANLPTGDYFVAGVSDASTADWRSVEFLAALSRSAVRVTIAEGERKTQALTVTR
jgi:hypothetical protein